MSDEKFYGYIDDVTSGKRVAGNLEKLAVQRFLKDIDDNKFYFDFEKGYKYVEVAKLCRHWKGEKAGQPIILEPHQEFYRIQQFGWLLDKDGPRRFRTCYKQVARKNGKTTEEAIVAPMMLLFDGENGPQVYATATKEAQARIVVNDTSQILLGSPDLKDYFTFQKFMEQYKRVMCNETNGVMLPMGRDSGKKDDGFDPSAGIVDEWAFHPNDEAANIIESGMGARKQPIMDYITTAGPNKQGPCYRMRTVATSILKGLMSDDRFLCLLFELDSEEEWEDPEMWQKPNPNLGTSVDLSYLHDRFTKAKNEGGTKEIDFKTKNLNLWTDSAKTWIPKEKWDKGNKNPITLDRREAYAGIQLAATTGSNSLTLCMPRNDSPIIDFRTYYWLPEQTARDDKELWDNYLRWSEQGFLTLTDGNVIDYSFIIQKIFELRDQVDLRTIMFAPHYESAFYPLLDAGFNMEKCSNTWQNMTAPIRGFEKLIAEDNVNHEGNMMLAYQIGLVSMKTGGDDYVRIDKDNSLGKVDGPVSLIMSYKAMIEAKEQVNPTIEVW